MKTTVISTCVFHPNWRALCYVVENKKDKLARRQLITTTLLS